MVSLLSACLNSSLFLYHLFFEYEQEKKREIDYTILSFSSNIDERISYEGWKKYRSERRKAWRERERGNTLTELTKRYLKRKSSWDFLETRPGMSMSAARSGNETGCGEEMCV